jgi:hypothetical protein
MAKAMPAKSMIGGGLQVAMPREARRPKKKHLKRMTIEKAKNGGHSITHAYESGPDMPFEPDTTHVFGKDQGAEAMKHIAKHAGLKMAEAAPAEQAKPGKKEPVAQAKPVGKPKFPRAAKPAAEPEESPAEEAGESPEDEAEEDE